MASYKWKLNQTDCCDFNHSYMYIARKEPTCEKGAVICLGAFNVHDFDYSYPSSLIEEIDPANTILLFYYPSIINTTRENKARQIRMCIVNIKNSSTI